MANDDGKTPERPEVESETCPAHPARGKHYWQWANLEDLGQPLKGRCTTCGEVRLVQRFKGQ